jgi:hypothetical protein
LFTLTLVVALFQQPALAPDALKGTMREGHIGLADELSSAEGWHWLPQCHDVLFDRGWGFAGW